MRPARGWLAMVLALGLAACGTDAEGPSSPDDAGGPEVASLEVSPDSAGMTSSDSLQVDASARDAQGNVISDPDISWRSTDSGVASVDGSGLVSAAGDGQAWIVAEADGEADSTYFRVTLASLDHSAALDDAAGGPLDPVATWVRNLRGDDDEVDYLDDNLRDEMLGADRIVVLEAVDVENERHPLIYFVRAGDELKMATNMTPDAPLTGPIQESTHTVDADIESFFNSLDSDPPAAGAGGDTGVKDGRAWLLTHITDTTSVQTLLYGFTFDEFTDSPRMPDGDPDLRRHEVAAGILDIWADLAGGS